MEQRNITLEILQTNNIKHTFINFNHSSVKSKISFVTTFLSIRDIKVWIRLIYGVSHSRAISYRYLCQLRATGGIGELNLRNTWQNEKINLLIVNLYKHNYIKIYK